MEIEEERGCSSSSIYKELRRIKKKESSVLYNALRSIYEDSVFVREISQGIWAHLPLIGNLRCGLWYSSPSLFDSTCYFKSTDGHTNNCSFSTSRLNLHVATLAAHRGGCIILDSTRRGKRFPDSMSKTIPIWACVLNRAIQREREQEEEEEGWDCDLHLPLWVSRSEKSCIEKRLPEWTRLLESCGSADIASLSSLLKKPLRPLWISQNTLIWLNQVPPSDSWDFTPIILLSASQSAATLQHSTSTSRFSWRYIPGAGDDEESWARGLTPALFWEHAYDLIDSGPQLCNQKVSQIVERSRVYRAQRGHFSPQLNVKSSHTDDLQTSTITMPSSISWVGSTNIALGATFHGN